MSEKPSKRPSNPVPSKAHPIHKLFPAKVIEHVHRGMEKPKAKPKRSKRA